MKMKISSVLEIFTNHNFQEIVTQDKLLHLKTQYCLKKNIISDELKCYSFPYELSSLIHYIHFNPAIKKVIVYYD